MEKADFDRGAGLRKRFSRRHLQVALGGALIVTAGVNALLGAQTMAIVTLLMGVGNVAVTAASGRSTDEAAPTERRPVITVTGQGPTEADPSDGDGHRPADD